jgi:prepilin-type N-terminal cleavage/methylation domain-containing protein
MVKGAPAQEDAMHGLASRRPALSGFTLIELMIVVVIIAILATVAVASYKRFYRRARVQEAIAFLGDVRIKQESYFQTYHRYVSSGASPTDWWPKSMNYVEGGNLWGIDCTKEGDAKAHPGWCSLGAGFASTEEIWFQVVVVGRDPGAPTVPPDTYVKNPNQDWWYARARADFDVDGEYSDIFLSSEMKEPFLDNELE